MLAQFKITMFLRKVHFLLLPTIKNFSDRLVYPLLMVLFLHFFCDAKRHLKSDEMLQWEKTANKQVGPKWYQ